MLPWYDMHPAHGPIGHVLCPPQATLVASWLTELYLDQINRTLLDESVDQALPSSPTAGAASSPTADDLSKQLQSFLATHLEARARC